MADDQSDSRDNTGSYRSGVAARLAGLPVETLRVWERRYGLSEPLRSPRGQRLYSSAQVRRLGMIKQLVDAGHPIGALARLPLEQLQRLAEPIEPGSVAGPLRIALVGAGIGRQLAAGGRDILALDIRRSCARIEEAATALRGAEAEVLLVELSELDDSALPLVAAARQVSGAGSVVVLYRFCASATIRHLRAQGCLVARAPSDMAEVVLLCHAALPGKRLQHLSGASERVAAPRFDEGALNQIAAARNNVVCECPRHLAEILLMVGSFERYTRQCGSRNPADAALHLELGHAAGMARSLLETALERLARADGLPLPDGMDARP